MWSKGVCVYTCGVIKCVYTCGVIKCVYTCGVRVCVCVHMWNN